MYIKKKVGGIFSVTKCSTFSFFRCEPTVIFSTSLLSLSPFFKSLQRLTNSSLNCHTTNINFWCSVTIFSNWRHYFQIILLQISKSKVGVRSRGHPDGSLFKSCYTEVMRRTLLLYLDCSTLPLIRALYWWVLSKAVSSTIFNVFGMTRPGIEPSSPGPLAIYI